ncbi:Uncharacterized protein PBTT_04307 [Plasmodiophora brassicae]|uniref:Uncharacterized protein n=1 Tax=Plasmodiophora brassicae TaxID=37360 RepID=A0A3P3Y9L4_PLABS|nr:unnamed protein product [Plasmodiophora brassicae]
MSALSAASMLDPLLDLEGLVKQNSELHSANATLQHDMQLVLSQRREIMSTLCDLVRNEKDIFARLSACRLSLASGSSRIEWMSQSLRNYDADRAEKYENHDKVEQMLANLCNASQDVKERTAFISSQRRHLSGLRTNLESQRRQMQHELLLPLQASVLHFEESRRLLTTLRDINKDTYIEARRDGNAREVSELQRKFNEDQAISESHRDEVEELKDSVHALAEEHAVASAKYEGTRMKLREWRSLMQASKTSFRELAALSTRRDAAKQRQQCVSGELQIMQDSLLTSKDTLQPLIDETSQLHDRANAKQQEVEFVTNDVEEKQNLTLHVQEKISRLDQEMESYNDRLQCKHEELISLEKSTAETCKFIGKMRLSQSLFTSNCSTALMRFTGSARAHLLSLRDGVQASFDRSFETVNTLVMDIARLHDANASSAGVYEALQLQIRELSETPTTEEKLQLQKLTQLDARIKEFSIKLAASRSEHDQLSRDREARLCRLVSLRSTIAVQTTALEAVRQKTEGLHNDMERDAGQHRAAIDDLKKKHETDMRSLATINDYGPLPKELQVEMNTRKLSQNREFHLTMSALDKQIESAKRRIALLQKRQGREQQHGPAKPSDSAAAATQETDSLTDIGDEWLL